MRKVQRHQMGAYLCIASNDVPPAVSKRVILNVNFAPEIQVPSQLYGVGPGHDVTISCNVQAFPEAINYWMKNDKEMLLDGPKYNISEDVRSRYELMMYLTIKNWQRSDESQFSCISTNSLGKADGKIQSYTFVPNEDAGTKSNSNHGYTATKYQVATNNDKGRKQDNVNGQDINRRHNKGSISLHHQTKNGDNWKSSSTEHHRNSKRRQRTRDGNTEKESSDSYGSSFFVNNGNTVSVPCLAKFLVFIIIVYLY